MAEQDTITVSEYIAQQEQLEKEAKELFPKKFDIPVYSCLTCNPNPSEEAGFCYSCSISCHGDHNLIELFTKRSFRCDCGTQKFKTTKCTIDPKPAGSINELNQYNHNYLGKFCWCDIQYDPAKEESTMLQCVVCEDWFHDTCIGITPHNDDFDDYICRTCTRAHPFLREYAQNSNFMIGLSDKGGGPKSTVMIDCSKKEGKKVENNEVAIETKREDEEADIVTSETTTIATANTINGSEATATATSETYQHKTEGSPTRNQTKRSFGAAIGPSSKDKNKEESDDGSNHNKKPRLNCKRPQLCANTYPDQEMNLYVTEGWRDLLCQCAACMALYTKENVPFILGEEAVYEDEEDDDAETSILEGGMKKLGEMDRVQMMDGMLAYSKMRDEIRRFLVPFSEQGRVVTADDVQAFFAARMEQRASLGGKPNFF
ncbi:hypothetical protein EDD11_004828 [Mortierella claussenii]|nr:hypothetical protein EDD11_004828 [Mortierella claussenii]